MLKRNEMTDPRSCLSRAAEDEPVFVLRAHDPLAPAIIRRWAAVARAVGMHSDKLAEAEHWALVMEDWLQKEADAASKGE